MSNTISYSKNEADNLFYLKEKGRLLEVKVEELGEGIKGSISPSMTTQDLHELDLGIYRAETSGLYAFPDPVEMDIPNETVADNTVPIGYSVLFSKEADGWRLFQAVKSDSNAIQVTDEINGLISNTTANINFDLNNNKVKFIGVINIISVNGSKFTITEQDVDFTGLNNFKLVYNKIDGVVSAVSLASIVTPLLNHICFGVAYINTLNGRLYVNGISNYQINGVDWRDSKANKQAVGSINSNAGDVVVDTAAKTVSFSGNCRVITNAGVYTISAPQVINYSSYTNYMTLWFNKILRQFAVTNATNFDNYTNTDYIRVGSLNASNANQSHRISVHGIEYFTVDGQIYPFRNLKIAEYSNRWFSRYSENRTNDEKRILNSCFLEVEGFNLNDASICIYRIGRDVVSNRTYLSFILNEKGSTITRYLRSPSFNMEDYVGYDPDEHSGIKEYEFYNNSRVNFSVHKSLKVKINWDLLPLGYYISESNAWASINNTVFDPSVIAKFSWVDSRLRLPNLLPTPTSISNYVSYNGSADYSFNGNTPKDGFGDIMTWYGKWDELVGESNNYSVTKEVLTDEVPAGGGAFLPIYAYRFKSNALRKADTTDSSDVSKMIKICITTAHHGNEKVGSFSLYEIVSMIMSGNKDSFIDYLRYNVELVIVPCVNPYGWSADGGKGQRFNFNGVDLNRNFGAGFQITMAQPSGPYAFSEIETRVVADWMERERNDSSVMGLVVDNFHGVTEANPKDYVLNWLVASSDPIAVNMWRELVTEMSRELKERYPEIPQDSDYLIGRINNYIAGGYTKDQFYELGYTCSFQLEVSQNFRYKSTYKSFDNDSMTCAIETILNTIRYSLISYLPLHNQRLINNS